MLRKISLGLVLGSITMLSACGSARLISQNQGGGVLELQGDRGKAMADANGQMASHCGPNNYQIVQQGEEAIGTDTFVREDTTSDQATSRSGRRSSSDTTTTGQQSTRTATAWRVHYQCAGAGGPPQGGPPQGPPQGPPPGQDPGGPPPGY